MGPVGQRVCLAEPVRQSQSVKGQVGQWAGQAKGRLGKGPVKQRVSHTRGISVKESRTQNSFRTINLEGNGKLDKNLSGEFPVRQRVCETKSLYGKRPIR